MDSGSADEEKEGIKRENIKGLIFWPYPVPESEQPVVNKKYRRSQLFHRLKFMLGNINSRQCYTARVGSGFLAVFCGHKSKVKKKYTIKSKCLVAAN